jgi:predicted RNA-binding protein with TRAM domain
MEVSDELLCLFSATVREEGDRYVIEVPKREVETGSLAAGDTYRVALIDGDRNAGGGREETNTGASVSTSGEQPQPPVEPGEVRYVEVEDIGKQGDGIARVERGYVIIVPGAEVGERVKIEVSEVKSNFAVGEIIEE